MKIVGVLCLFAIAADATTEGDSCNKNGVAGVCANIRECPAALEDIRNRIPPQHCGLGSVEPIVCCVSIDVVVTTTKRPVLTTTKRTQPSVDVGDKAEADLCEPLPLSLTAKPNGQKAWDKCLEYQDKLVFPCRKGPSPSLGYSRSNRCHHNADELSDGGEVAALDEFPHMALLGYGNDPANLQWLCGGSLISEKFVLTAGRCISSREGGDVTHVQLGTLRRSSMSAKNRFRVKRIIKHPQYNPPHKYNDIALLELETAVRVTEHLVPACLHTGSPVNESRASATGWGINVYDGPAAENLKQVILRKFEALECGETYFPTHILRTGIDDSSQICYGGGTVSEGTCQNDGGGPLQIKNKQIACMYTILGVASMGVACRSPGKPEVYTRVSPYVPWIEGVVWP